MARKALRAGMPTYVLVRNRQSPAAIRLAAIGARLVEGDLNDAKSLHAACRGMEFVFSLQQRPMSRGGYGLRGGGMAASMAAARSMNDLDPDVEFYQARNLIHAACASGVAHVVQVSSAMEQHVAGRSMPSRAKLKIEALVTASDTPSWTILRPGLFMESLITYLEGDRLITGWTADTTIGWVATADVAATAVLATLDTERFRGRIVKLVGDVRTYRETGAVLSTAWGRAIDVTPLSDDEALACGLAPDILRAHRNMADVAPPAGPEEIRSFGVQITSLEQWAASNRPVLDGCSR
ncbi:MAG: NmrA family protein [Ilumatobacteraceae bacterium]|nr:NmrA family protein [Ilumatobacteraceae bacterium]